MIPHHSNKKYIHEFFYGMHAGFSSKQDFLGRYYRALLVDSNVRFLKRHYLAGDVLKLNQRMNSILSESTKSEKDLDLQFNITLYNIIKFHLDEFIGKENTEKNLESIELELNSLCDNIFLNDTPFTLHVEDTTHLKDESKTTGSKFSVRIVPNELLF